MYCKCVCVLPLKEVKLKVKQCVPAVTSAAGTFDGRVLRNNLSLAQEMHLFVFTEKMG